ncbi:hypothetical protein [Deinococcus ruber]|uniref:hypothetical protein n=1 Tax=Deinococcus ruber TaxID=1848197 RepID=UPI00166EEBFE|nr:hypothetical protein [Deinococcus ruber]
MPAAGTSRPELFPAHIFDPIFRRKSVGLGVASYHPSPLPYVGEYLSITGEQGESGDWFLGRVVDVLRGERVVFVLIRLAVHRRQQSSAGDRIFFHAEPEARFFHSIAAFNQYRTKKMQELALTDEPPSSA